MEEGYEKKREGLAMKLIKSKFYVIEKRIGQYELTTTDNQECFFMHDTDKYEYFENPKIEEYKEAKK